MGLGMRQAAIWLALAVFGSFLLLMALRASPAAACKGDGPCDSPTTKVHCPAMTLGSSATYSAQFTGIPKDGRNLKYTIKNASTGQVYDEAHPICANNTMSVSAQRISGGTTDEYKVDYTLTSNGASNPAEEHDVIVTADWDRESDLGAIKVLLGGERDVNAEEEVTIALTIHNYGPAPTNGVLLVDKGSAFSIKQFEVTGIDQVAGPKPTVEPGLVSDDKSESKSIKGQWGVIQPGEDVTILVHVRVKVGFKEVGDVLEVKHRSDSKRVEPSPDPHPNEDFLKFKVRSAPDSKIKAAGAGGANGTATPAKPALEVVRPGLGIEPLIARLKKVQVAILRLGGGKALQGGLPEKPTRKAGGCKWLANKGGRKFTGRKRSAAGICDSPVWIDATGTSRWSLDLVRSLPTGKYVVYSRAVGSNGVAESEFTAKDGNRKAILVH
jgi:hypothetical protein